MPGHDELWLQHPVPRPDARQRLVCFPHAGGSAVIFRDWGNHLTDTAVYAVRYPGRAERIDEPAPDDLPALGRRIARAVAQLGDLPLALFGHSMGAGVALETARSLESLGVPVSHLFASGSRNAPLPAPPPPEADDAHDDPATVARLISLGGTDPQLAADPLFQELVLPYIRSDGRMFHAYMRSFSPEPRLRCPVTTIVGDADADADERPWPELTAGPFREVVVPGDHFYLTGRPPFALLEPARKETP
ncbi:thioesterase II family protein [Dactylosporangium sp. CA-139114]|uniref:thioesterase II family protein n=1 Tax=Dactylosporangium sp. CA-139114 TaxID=3239931 RepID=UPI003D99A45E